MWSLSGSRLCSAGRSKRWLWPVNLLCPCLWLCLQAFCCPKGGGGTGRMRGWLFIGSSESCPGFLPWPIWKSISASSAGIRRCEFCPRGAVYFAFSPWKTSCLLHTARQLWARPAWEIKCPTGEPLQLGCSWESFLGSLTSQQDCLGRSQVSGLCRVSHGFADKLLISIMVSTWQSLQNTRWKVSKLFIQKMLIFKITVNHLVFKAGHSAPLLMSLPRPGC